MGNFVKHRFGSAKADGADATQIQPSHWNDGHLFVGGVQGDLLARDGADPTYGASWAKPGLYKHIDFVTPGGEASDWDPPPGITGPTNIVVQTTGDLSLTGFKPAAGVYEGQLIRVVLSSVAPGRILIFNGHANSTAGYRIHARTAVGVGIPLTGIWGFVDFVYLTTTQYGAGWLMASMFNGLAV